MRSVRDVFYIGWQCFEKNMKHPRILLVFAVFFCMILDRVGMFNTAAKLTGASNTPWFLPFLLTDGFAGFYVLLEFVLIFCDAPFIDSHQPYVIIRTGKTKWLLGQLLYILWMSLFCVLSLQLFMIIVLLPTISFTTDWGNIIYTLSRMPIKDFQPEFQIYYALVERYTPLAATAYSGLILWLQGAIIGCLMLLFNFFIKKDWEPLLDACMRVLIF